MAAASNLGGPERNVFRPSGRELEFAQWNHVLALKGIAEVFLKTVGELYEELDETSRWRWFKRRRILRDADGATRLYEVAYRYAQSQKP